MKKNSYIVIVLGTITYLVERRSIFKYHCGGAINLGMFFIICSQSGIDQELIIISPGLQIFVERTKCRAI